MSDEERTIHFSDSFERILKKAAEQFSCLRKTHDDAERFTTKCNTYLTIPTIILSGLAGLGAVGSENLLPFNGSQTLVGMISFTCATLQTISSFFAFAKRAEAHRQAAIQYARLQQLITLELSLSREERMPADKMMMLLKDESSRLLETAPQLPYSVVTNFKQQFKDTKVSVPSTLNGLEEVQVESSVPTLTQTPRPKVTLVSV
jgi:hypothetical protein